MRKVNELIIRGDQPRWRNSLNGSRPLPRTAGSAIRSIEERLSAPREREAVHLLFHDTGRPGAAAGPPLVMEHA